MPPALQAGQPDPGGPVQVPTGRGPTAALRPGRPGPWQPADPPSSAPAATPRQTARSVRRSCQQGGAPGGPDWPPCVPPVMSLPREGHLDSAQHRRVVTLQWIGSMRVVKAAVRTRYGPPEVVRIAEAATPEPGDTELLVKVHATT